MTQQTRKRCRKNKRNCDKDAKKGTMFKCRLKTCRAKKYQSVYGASVGGSIRSNISLFY